MNLFKKILGLVSGLLLVGVFVVGGSNLLQHGEIIPSVNEPFLGAYPSNGGLPGIYNATGTDLVLRDGYGSALATDQYGRVLVSTSSRYGDIIPTTDNAYDLGTSTSRWRSGFFGTSVSSTLFIASQGTNSAPSYSFTNDSDTGIYNGSGNEVSITSGGTIRLAVGAAGVVLRSSSSLLAGSDNASDVGASATRMRTGYFGTSVFSPLFVVTSTGTGIQLYNTTDQVTNYERGNLGFTSNRLELTTSQSGTGGERVLRLYSRGSAGSQPVFDLSSTTITASRSSGGTHTVFTVGGTQTQSSGAFTGVSISPAINQSGTGSYSTLLINPTETATGSGAKNLIQAQVGSVDKFTVTNAGIVSAGGGSANKAMCWKTDGITLGYCSSVVDVAGGCTCN